MAIPIGKIMGQDINRKIDGIFYEESSMTIGTGHTQQTQHIKNYCNAIQKDKEMVSVAYLGENGKPTGIKVDVPLDEFLKRYTFEPDYKVKSTEERQADKHSAKAEKHRKRKEFNSSEWEYTKAIRVDPENVRANFGIGVLYLEMGEEEKAKKVFKKLSQIEAVFEDENKHIFNEFGIELRKNGMLDEALANYLKAMEISPRDENLYFNVARVYYAQKDSDKAIEFLNKALAINIYFREAKQFMDFIKEEANTTAHGQDQEKNGP